MKKGLQRAALLAVGLLFAVFVLELGLRFASSFVAFDLSPEAGSARAAKGENAGRRVLCLGDSNTYGLWLKERERDSYPGQLESLWNDGERPPLEVVNLGYPGTNSSRILQHLPRWIDIVQPDELIVMIGVNDFWTIPVGTSGSRLRLFLEENSRLYKTVYLLVQRARLGARGATDVDLEGERPGMPPPQAGRAKVGGHEFEMEFVSAQGKRAGAVETRRALARNLTDIQALARARGVEITLMTYPSRHFLYSLANATIRETAAQLDASFVDLTERFRPLCPKIECPEWLYDDNHPRAKGYTIIAESLVEHLDGRQKTEAE